MNEYLAYFYYISILLNFVFKIGHHFHSLDILEPGLISFVGIFKVPFTRMNVRKRFHLSYSCDSCIGICTITYCDTFMYLSEFCVSLIF